MCPYAEKRKFPFLLCRKMQRDGTDYNILNNALTAYCMHQRFCRCENGVVNTDNALKCTKLSER